MARQNLNQIKVDKLKAETGLDIIKVMIRGGTNHRKDLCLSDGTITCLFKDGTLEKSNDKWFNPKAKI